LPKPFVENAHCMKYRKDDLDGIRKARFASFVLLIICFAVVLFQLIGIFFYVSASNSRCIIRPTHIETNVGIFAKEITTLEISRITDLALKQNLIERLLGIGTIHVTSNDPDIPELIIYQIPKVKKVYNYLKQITSSANNSRK